MENEEIRKIANDNLSGNKDYDFYDRFLNLSGKDSIDQYFDGFYFDKEYVLNDIKNCFCKGESVFKVKTEMYRPFYNLMEMVLILHGIENLTIISIEEFIEDYCNIYFYKLFETAKRYFVSKIDSSGDGFTEWLINCGYSQLSNDYPLAFCMIHHLFDLVALNISECVERIEQHRTDIKRHLDVDTELEMVKIECGVSDLHNHGKCVVITHYSDGKGIVYKPRDMRIDLFWNDFLDKINSFENMEELRGVKTLAYDGYGFCQYIKYEPRMSEMDLKKYYERCGELLCLVVLFGGSDFHHENLIVSGGYPILLDLETLLTPVSKKEYSSVVESEDVENELSLNLSRSLLLSKWVGTSFESAVNIGALTAYNLNHHNYPMFEDGTIAYSDLFTENIVSGYKKCYKLIILNKEWFKERISGLGECFVRFVLRDTRVYYRLFAYMSNPKYLHNELLFCLSSLRVFAPFLLAAGDDVCSKLFPLIMTEQDALLDGNVPIFYCKNNEDNLYVMNNHKIVRNFFAKSPLDGVYDTIEYFSPQHLEREIKYLKTIMEISKVHRRDDYKSIWSYLNISRSWITNDESNEDFCKCEIERISKIIDDYVLDANKRIYYAPIKNTLNGYYDLEIMKNTLYDGAFGVYYYLSLFDAWKRKDTSEEMKNFIGKWCDDFLLERTKLKYHSLGISSGISGVLLFLCKEAELYCDVDYYDYAAEIIMQIEENDIVKAKESDYFGGLSGLLYVTCMILENSSDKYDKKLHETVYLLVDELLDRIDGKQHLWFDEENQYKPLIGLAHGQTGYILALSSSLKFLNQDRKEGVSKIIREALKYEEEEFSVEDCNLPDYRRFFVKMRDAEPNKYVKRFMYGNCSGIVGATLAYIKIYKILGEPKRINIWCERALNFMEKTPFLGNDSLCCGTASWIDLLIEIRKNLAICERANIRLNTIISSIRKQGYVFNSLENIDDISLFRGITGMGYVYLRLNGDFPCIVV